MSLSDKIIKNTFYYILLQLSGFLFPIILTPFIISKIGEVQFGIYALVLGFIGIFSLFDLSISSSFIVFISKYYVKKDFINLNKYFNTGLFFYILFSLLIVVPAYFFAKPLLSLLKIPPELFETSVKVYYIGLLVFFVTSAFTIFSSVLISLQKMYVTSAAGIFIGLFNLIATVIILNNGSGLEGILWIQLICGVMTNLISIIYAKKSLPELKIGFMHLEKNPVKEMTRFGAQMQVSKLASFASEKYDEFLLAYFSVLNNVTYFNIANRISRTGRLIPFQLIPQVAPVAAEFNAKNDSSKLKELYSDITRYLTIVSLPVFIFIFIFANLIITTWVGPGFELSVNVLRILAVGQAANMILSAPGNSIIPNMGIPKFQMREGLIYLAINLLLSFFLIKYYGILGAAFGNVASIIISSAYVFFISSEFFSKSRRTILFSEFSRPFFAGIVSGLVTGFIFYISDKYIFEFNGRISGIIYLLTLSAMFLLIYAALIFNLNYLNNRDKVLAARIIMKIIPRKFLGENKKLTAHESADYNNEVVSIFIVTHNRLSMLRKCVQSILPTLENINYELIIIDNASDDGTKEFLTELKNQNDKIRIILNEKNTGINAKSLGAEAATGEFIIGTDDDVIKFPDDWVKKMVSAYKSIPGIGYLATDVVQDETTNGAKHPSGMYTKEIYGNGNIVLEVGPTGGWCFMISREVYKKIGKLVTFDDRIFYPEDGDYLNRIINSGLRYGILSGVKVYHATGEFHNKDFKTVFDNKHMDFKRGNPGIYEFKAKLRRMFSINRFALKLREYANKKSD